MNISLPKNLENYVQGKVDSGMYTSASEVIRESLRTLIQHENIQNQQIAILNRDIEAGLDQINSGNTISAQAAYNSIKSKIDEK